MAKRAETFRTAVQIDQLKPGAERREIPDALLPGHYHVIQPTGARSWAVRYRAKGKPRKLTIGTYPLFSLVEARKLAKAAQQAAAEGRDPAGERRDAKSASVEDVTDKVEGAFQQYLARHVGQKNRLSTAAEVERLIKREILPAWKGRRIQEIGRRDVRQLIDGLIDRGTPYQANRVHSLLRKAFKWFLERDIVQATPVAHISRPASEEERDRVLTTAETKLFWQACTAQGWPFGPIAQLLLLTGQRRDEVGQATWSEFDLDAKEPTWTIPKERAKNGEAQTVALAPVAVEILCALPHVKAKDGAERFVFTTTGETPVSGFSKGKVNLDAQMLAIARQDAVERGEDPERVTIAPWRFHDLRRTAASGMARLNIPPHVVDKVLNHKTGTVKGVAAIYNRHDYGDERRRAWLAWGDYLKTLINEQSAANVVALRAGK